MTNEAALGYMIGAARNIKMSERHIERLLAAMREVMDEHTEAEAEHEYRNF